MPQPVICSQQQLYEQVFNALEDPVCLLNAQGVIVACNSALLALPHLTSMRVGVHYSAAYNTGQLRQSDESALYTLTGIRNILSGNQDCCELDYACLNPDVALWFKIRVVAIHSTERCALIVYKNISVRKAVESERDLQSLQIKALGIHLSATDINARQHLSRDLHDATSPNLAAIRLNLDALLRELQADRHPASAERIADLRALLEDTGHQLGELCTDLRLPGQNSRGLLTAIELAAQQFSIRAGIPVYIECASGNRRATQNVELTLLRIFNESMTNIVKHANAALVKIFLQIAQGHIALQVSDDGCGFNPDQTTGRHGIVSMRELCLLSGGTLVINSRPDGGTKVSLTFTGISANIYET